MISDYIQRIANETGRETDELKVLWDEAFARADTQKQDKNLAYIINIFKRLLKGTS